MSVTSWQHLGGFGVDDMAYATRMQAVLLGRYKSASATADLLMLGWTPPTLQCEPAYLDPMIDEILAKGAEWLETLKGPAPIKVVEATRPATMGREQIKRLHDRIYARATATPQLAGGYVRLIREQATARASHWQLQLLA